MPLAARPASTPEADGVRAWGNGGARGGAVLVQNAADV